MVTIKDLEAFGDGWNRHDVDFIMGFMADDCVFETTAGPEACGKRFTGREQVREAFAGVFKRFPDANFGNARHFVAGDRGVSEWLFTATTPDGSRLLPLSVKAFFAPASTVRRPWGGTAKAIQRLRAARRSSRGWK